MGRTGRRKLSVCKLQISARPIALSGFTAASPRAGSEIHQSNPSHELNGFELTEGANFAKQRVCLYSTVEHQICALCHDRTASEVSAFFKEQEWPRRSSS